MKDKSRFISSVIVSLLAGFIYLLSIENIPINIQSSVKGVLSYNEPEKYLTTGIFPFYEVSSKSDSKIQKTRSSFYIKNKKTGNNDFTKSVSGTQASFVLPVPDRNIDFTSELEKLIKNKSEDYSNSYINQSANSGKNKILSCNEFQIADAERNFKRTERISKDFIEFNLKYDEGNGFYYNDLTDEIPQESGNCEIQILNSNFAETGSVNDLKISVNYNCNQNFNVTWNQTEHRDYKQTNNVYKVDKIKIKVRKINLRTNSRNCNEIYEDNERVADEDYDSDPVEINSNDNSEEDIM